MCTVKGVQPINDLINRNVFSTAPSAFALHKILQQILKCSAKIARIKSCLPDEIIVQADIDRSFWRCPIMSHGGLYVHIMRTFMPRLAHFSKGFTQQKFGSRMCSSTNNRKRSFSCA